ncbi:FG-GAP-like repeat-containing protein [Hymenobacter sp. UYP22]|uniref:FG-GAP-like repeat-containing protein n=1 Tax=Hymenobacter sp. UYP22 TaxID=3156348 RepID=UPI003395A26D
MPNFYARTGNVCPSRSTRCLLLLLLLTLGPASFYRAFAQAPAWQLAMSGNNNQPILGTSVARATVTDASGDVLVAGHFNGQVTFGSIRLSSAGSSDLFVAKWNTAAGAWTWAASGGGTGADFGYGLAVSGSSVYVSGAFTSDRNVRISGQDLPGAGGTDAYVAKFTDNGSSVTNGWAVSGGGTGFDYSYGVAVSGPSVYVTGSFVSNTGAVLAGQALPGGGGNDVYLAKFTDAGSRVVNGWVAAGGGTGADVANGVVVRGSEVYITGSFASARGAIIAGQALAGAGGDDMFVAKYTDNGADFTNGWVIDDGGLGADTGYALAVNGTSVYATGYSASTQPVFAGQTLSGAGDADLFLAKYTDTGAGFSNGWATGGGGSSADYGYGLTVSGSTVFLSGSFHSLGRPVVAGQALTGRGGRDAYVAQFNDNGTSFSNGWVATGGGGNNDSGYGVTVTTGGVFLAAGTGGDMLSLPVASFGGAPALSAPLDAAVLGQLQPATGTWLRLEAPLQGTESQVNAAATDAAGNVFVTGSFAGQVSFGKTQLLSAGSYDVFVAKWNTAASSWDWAVSGGGRNIETSNGIAVSGSNVYITGTYNGIANSTQGPVTIAGQTLTSAANSQDVFVAKFIDNGNSVANGWAISAGGDSQDFASSIAASGTSIYITGFYSGSAAFAGQALTSAGATDIVVAKYVDNGLGVSNGWAVSGGGPNEDVGRGIAVSGANVYVTGAFTATATLSGQPLTAAGLTDVFVAKYTDAGASVANGWAAQGGGASTDAGLSIALSGSSVYATGSFLGSATFAGQTFSSAGANDLFVAKYVDNGPSFANGWALRGGGPSDDKGYAIAAVGNNVYLTGGFTGNVTLAGQALTANAGNQNLFVAKYGDNGSSVSNGWASSGGGSGTDAGLALAVSGPRIYAAGYVTPAATFGSFTLINPANTLINFLGRVDEPLPVITSFTPTSGYEGTNVTLNGTNLAGTTLITFAGSSNNTVSTDFVVNAAGTQITDIYVPAGAQTGPIRVTTAGGTATSTDVFTVTPAVPNPVPTMTALSPATAPGGSGPLVLTVNGVNFAARAFIQFNGVTLPTTRVSSSELTAQVPASALAAPGTYSVTVTNPTPGGGTSAPLPFLVTVPVPPVVLTFTPVTGPVGTRITINGTDLGRTSVITFTGTVANTVTTGFAVNAAGTQITNVTVPAGAQTGPIRVTTPVGTATSPAEFTVTNTGAPAISSLSPTRAAAGMSVRVTGTNLSSITGLRVNGVAVPLTSITASTNTSFTFLVPAGATATGNTTVTTTSGTSNSAALTIDLRSSSDPAANSTRGAVANSLVTVHYSEPVTGSPTLAVYSAQAGGRKLGTVTAGGSVAQFSATPGRSFTSFRPGEVVQVSLPTPVRSSGGIVAARKVFQFTAAVAGLGRGAFLPGPDPVVGAGPEDVAMGDVDGDGDLDVLTANTTDNSVSVLLNSGAGAFTAAAAVTVGAGPVRVLLGDVDGDGDLDLLAASYSAGTVSVRLNNGTGSFGGTQEVAAGNGPRGLALGDVDGDGDLDLAVGNGVSNLVVVRLNGSDSSGSNTGIFGGGQTISASTESGAVALADVDNDGDLDLLAASLVSNLVAVRLNGGDATGSNTGVFSGTGFVTVRDSPTNMAVGDVDGDGDLDVLTANFGTSSVSVCVNNGSGSFTNPRDVAVGPSPYDIALADVDADGDLDLLTANDDFGPGGNTVSVRLNGGDATGSNTGVFSNGSTVAVGEQPRSLALADVDGDGDLDLVAGNSVGNTVSVRLNGGTVPLATRASPARLVATLYPNPAHTTVRLTDAPARTPVHLLDAVGRQVSSGSTDATGQAVLSWPAGLARGVYVVRIGSQTLRLIID